MFATFCHPLVAPRRRGGWRQQLDRDSPGPLPLPPRAALRHLRNWGDGRCSSREVIANMKDLVLDGTAHPMVHRIAQLNDARGLLTLLEDCGIAEPIAELPPGGLVKQIMKPSSLLARLHDFCPQRFIESLGCGDEDLLAGFWQELLPKAPELREHPAFRGTAYTDWAKIVPCTLHEDAGPFTKQLSCNVVSFGCLFGRGGDTLTQFPITAYLKTKQSADDTTAMWAPILRDFEELASVGVGPWKFF